jgi:signal transduction histidine kinase
LITESYQTYGERALHFRHQRFKFDIMGEGTVLLAAHPMLMGSSESKMMSVVTLQDIAHHPTNETPRALARPSGIFHAGDASDGDARPENPNVADATSADSWIGAPVAGLGDAGAGTLRRGGGPGFPRLSRAAQNDATDAFVHDINNLLTVIDGGLRLLDATTNAGDRARIVQNLQRTVERGASLSRRWLRASRLDSAASSICAWHIVDIRNLLDRTLRSDVTVDAKIAPDVCQFLADPEELHSALLNLCKNASEAMVDGGRISISARNVHRGQTGYVEIAVSDEGTGMPQDVLVRAFDPYYTTKAPGKGTGLGLDQVRRFVESNGGAVQVESVPDAGTTVRMLFPCVAI